MYETFLDRWTKELARAAVEALRSTVEGFREDPHLLGELSQRVREVIARELPRSTSSDRPIAYLSEELAMAVYLTVATDGPEIGLTPQLLPALNLRLARTLESLRSPGEHEQPRGGALMKKALTITAVLLLALLAGPQAANAVPEFAKQWASSCGSCHVGAPTELDEEGIAFRLAGYSNDVDAKYPRPKYFFSFLTEALSFTETESMEAPESATLFGLFRLDPNDKVKVFAIGEVVDDPVEGLELDFAHGHLQVNPLAQAENLNVRLGNIEPMTRLWNTDMRRVFETSLWGGVDPGSGALSAPAGGHAHGSSTGAPAVLPASDWGGDISSVIGRNLLVSGGIAGDNVFAGLFWKKGGRAFDNSTVPSGFEYSELTEDERNAFNTQQTNLAKKWERSLIFGLSGYVGNSTPDVFDGSFLSEMEAGHDEHGEEHGDEGEEHGDEGEEHGDEGEEHGDEGEEHGDEHAAEGEHHDAFFPTRTDGTSRLVGEIKTRWDRWGLYLVGVYGENDYLRGNPEHWEETGEFELIARESTDFFAWAAEASARFSVSRKLNGRAAVRYEALSPEGLTSPRFERIIANLTVPVRLMRPAVWPYVETERDLNLNDWDVRGGLKVAF